MMPETNLQAFVRALYAAHGASEAVDRFDLWSDNEASVKEWDCLLEQERVAFRSLHEICRRIPVDDLVDEE